MVVKRVEILQFIFAKVVQEHTLGAVGSAYLILLEIYSGVTVPKLYKLVDSQLSYCENKKRVSVFLRRSVGYVKITAVVRLSMQLSTARPLDLRGQCTLATVTLATAKAIKLVLKAKAWARGLHH